MEKGQDAISQETDRRLLDRKLLRGQLTEEQLARSLAALPDLSEYAEEVNIVLEGRSFTSKKESGAD